MSLRGRKLGGSRHSGGPEFASRNHSSADRLTRAAGPVDCVQPAAAVVSGSLLPAVGFCSHNTHPSSEAIRSEKCVGLDVAMSRKGAEPAGTRTVARVSKLVTSRSHAPFLLLACAPLPLCRPLMRVHK